MKEERRARERAKKETSGNIGNRGYSGWSKPSREDKSHLKCTYPDCGRTGHTEETCWVKSPEKIPRSLKNKLPKHKRGRRRGVGAVNSFTDPEKKCQVHEEWSPCP